MRALRKDGRQLSVEMELHADRVAAEGVERRRRAENFHRFNNRANAIVAKLPLPKGVQFKMNNDEMRSPDALVVEARYTVRSRPGTTGPALETFVKRVFKENDVLDELRLTVRDTVVQPALRNDKGVVTLTLSRKDLPGELFVKPPPPATPPASPSNVRVLLVYVAPALTALVGVVVLSLFYRSCRSAARRLEFD